MRDEPKPAIRAFYSMMACAFSHSVFEPVEHRWGWGQYFGPPSTDGAWFELYRNMLLNELSGNSLLVGQAIPRVWLADGNQVRASGAPTHFGPVNLRSASEAAKGIIHVVVEFRSAHRPPTLLVRLRHPEEKPLQSVTVNGQKWTGFDAVREWVRIGAPQAARYDITAYY